MISSRFLAGSRNLLSSVLSKYTGTMGTVSSLRRSGSNRDGDMVEAVVCKESDLQENEMKVCQLADAGRILVAKHGGQIYALGNKCCHYGAPLDKGVLCKGRVRCPWHGACFSLATGDIEDFPGLDALPSYQVRVDRHGSVHVRASRALVAAPRRHMAMCRRHTDDTSTVLVLGGGGAGASCVESLRQAGYRGRVILATSEPHLPYDRPKLSKALDMSVDKLVLRSADFYQSCDVEVLTCHEATSVDTARCQVTFSNNSQLTYNHLVVATGCRPRLPDTPGNGLDGVFTLRSPEDGAKIAAAVPGKRLVIFGSGFIGMELAAFCVDKAAAVTVVGHGALPLWRALGTRVGAWVQSLHEQRGVQVKNKLSVVEFGANGSNGANCLSHVVLSDGSVVDADVCVVAVGVEPCTDFLGNAVQLDSRGYIVVDETLRSSCANVFAAGDVASFPLPVAGGARVTIGHWQMAHQLGRVAAYGVAAAAAAARGGNGGCVKPVPIAVPFFWTQMFGKSIRYTGYGGGGYDDVLVDGDMERQQAFVAFYCRADTVCAVASLGRDPAAARWAEHMTHHGMPTKQLVQQQLCQE